MDTSYTTQNGQNLGPTLKIQWYLLNEICTDIHLLVSCRKTVRRSFIGTWMGKSTKLELSVCSSKTKIILVGLRGRHKNGGKKAEDASHVEDIDEEC